MTPILNNAAIIAITACQHCGAVQGDRCKSKAGKPTPLHARRRHDAEYLASLREALREAK